VLGKVMDKLDVIPGSVPNLVNLPPGCRFAPRCRAREQYGLSICTDQMPGLVEARPDHQVRCWLYQSLGDHQAPLQP
jgi:oligopeptide/dipeptide ABC transporter ATP-binding protein